MDQMPGHRAQAAQAVLRHWAASVATRAPRIVPGISTSSRWTAFRSLSRQVRVFEDDAATIADTANNPASLTTNITSSPSVPLGEHGSRNRHRGVKKQGQRTARRTSEHNLMCRDSDIIPPKQPDGAR